MVLVILMPLTVRSSFEPINVLYHSRVQFVRDVITYKLKAGDMAMHHPSSPHCSMPNTSKG